MADGGKAERRVLVVTGVPKSATAELLENYLEVVCDADVERVELNQGGDVALVHFCQDLPELAEVRNTAARMKLLQFEEVGEPTTLLVQGVTEVTPEELLELYFESKRSGGREDSVEKVKVMPSLGLALVTFKSSQVASAVLRQTSHQPIRGQEVTVQTYIEPFHSELLRPRVASKPLLPTPASRDPPNFFSNSSPSPSPSYSSAPPPAPASAPPPPPAPAPAPAPASTPAPEVTETAKLHEAKTRLLAKLGFKGGEDCPPGVQVRVDGPGGQVEFRGEAGAIQQAKLNMYIAVNDFVHQEADLPQGTLDLLASSSQQGGQLLQRLKARMEDRQAELHVENGKLNVTAASQQVLDSVLQLLQSLVVTSQVRCEDVHAHYLAGEAWRALEAELQQGGCLALRSEGTGRIVLEGLQEEVEAARVRVEQALKENALKDFSFTLEEDKALPFRHFHSSVLKEQKDVVSKSGGSWLEKDGGTSGRLELEVQARPDVVAELQTKLTHLKSSLWQKILDLEQVSGPDNLGLLVRGLIHCSGFKQEAEQRFHCFLKLQLPSLQEQQQSAQGPEKHRSPGAMLLKWFRGKSKSSPTDEAKPAPAAAPAGPSPILSTSIQMGTTTVSVKQGDIAKQKADVLVNVVPSDRKLNITAVSKAFIKAGGPSFQQAYEAATGQLAIEQVRSAPSDSEVIVTRTNNIGSLQCSYVFHLPLHKWKAGVDKLLQQVVEKSLAQTVKHGASSIAFPSLGHGQLFHYPSQQVARLVLDQLRRSLTGGLQGKLTSVVMVIYDQGVYQEFLQELNRSQSPAAAPTPRPAPAPAPASAPRPASKKRPSLTPTEVVKLSKKAAAEAAAACKGEAKLTVSGRSEEEGRRALQGITKMLKDDFLFLMPPISTQLELTEEAFQQVLGLGQDLPVSIFLKESGNERLAISVKGERNAVTKVHSDIVSFCMEEMGKAKEDKLKRPDPSNLGEFAQWMYKNGWQDPPSYWTHFTSENPVNDWVLQGAEAKLVSVDPATFKAVEELVEKTWKQLLVGHGRDAKGLQHSKLSVSKVERLENPLLLQGYLHKRSSFFQRVAKTGAALTPISQIADTTELMTRQHATAPLKRELFAEINEHYLFHGTKPEITDRIVHGGLDSRMNTNGMFGTGIYLAESSTKADQYADPKTNRTGGDKKMLLVRAVLGDPWCTNAASSDLRRPPCRVAGCHKDNCEHQKDPHDSVMAHSTWNFREFVLYDRDMTYPEYFITYTRV